MGIMDGALSGSTPRGLPVRDRIDGEPRERHREFVRRVERRRLGCKEGRGHANRNIDDPADTPISIRLGSTIDTGTAEDGGAFEGTLAEALSVGGTVVAPTGSAVEGKITKAISSGRLKTPAELALVLTSLTVKGGKEVAISTNRWSMKGGSHAKRNVGMIGGGAGAGALIGGLTGGKKGAAIGAAVGAGAGTAGAAATGKDEITLPPETALNFKLASPLEVTVAK